MISNIKLICFLFLLSFGNASCQNSMNGDEMAGFNSYFKSLKKPLLIDDIAVKYSKNKVIAYSVLKKYIKDSSGQPLITIDNEKYHLFQAIGTKKINDSISCYFFSHRTNVNNDYDAYIAVFNKNNLTDFRSVYSNSTDGFGSIFIDTKYSLFKANDSTFYDYYKINNQGFIFEDEKKTKVENIDFVRENPYILKLNAKFYRDGKVLLKVNQIKGEKTKQALRNIAEKDLILKQSFFIDSTWKDEVTELIYLNLLSSKDEISFKNVYEVIEDKYSNNKWIENIPLSEYFIMPNGKEVVKEYTLKN
ncbi:hypothetical protein [Aequorivita xiaoshiensis]|uniref:DKNYY family protein n=1 Tax=Aequorivita xiaoshiensis TaxID=2874476 RepID=A0A9X1U619_9FLAO|nr:hypothetical protein [Aequorivita xiaoshiensis]MCG2430767.1 hypothetical protein [Aequorivita xiaoshiensis]